MRYSRYHGVSSQVRYITYRFRDLDISLICMICMIQDMFAGKYISFVYEYYIYIYCRRGGGAPRRRNRAERRSVAGEIRRPKDGQLRLRTKLGLFILHGSGMRVWGIGPV